MKDVVLDREKIKKEMQEITGVPYTSIEIDGEDCPYGIPQAAWTACRVDQERLEDFVRRQFYFQTHKVQIPKAKVGQKSRAPPVAEQIAALMAEANAKAAADPKGPAVAGPPVSAGPDLDLFKDIDKIAPKLTHTLMTLPMAERNTKYATHFSAKLQEWSNFYVYTLNLSDTKKLEEETQKLNTAAVDLAEVAVFDSEAETRY